VIVHISNRNELFGHNGVEGKGYGNNRIVCGENYSLDLLNYELA